MQQVQGTLPIGTIVRDRYIIEELLGRGGSGAVYLVRDQRVRGNLFALKEVIDPKRYARERFLFEAELLRRLEHRALPRVYRVFDDENNNRAYMLMDYVEGPNLVRLRQRQSEKRFSLPQVLTMLAPIMDAVNYLHSQQPPVIHRDIKPANIIVSPTGNDAVLVDLGIAKEYDPDSTTTAIRRASPGYAAPEQYSKGTNTRTDIYGLGATLYTLLTGVVPTDALYRMTRLGSKGVDPLEPVNQLNPAIPQSVADVIQRAMSLSSKDRYSTVQEFWQALNNANTYSGWQSAAPAPITPIPPSRPPSSHPAVVLGRPKENMTASSLPGPTEVFPSRRRPVLLLLLLALLVLLAILGVAAASWAFLTGQQVSHTPTPVSKTHTAATAAITPASSPTAQPSPTSTPAASPTAAPAYPPVAGVHNGTIRNTTANVTTSMTLSIQQNGGNISGNFTVGPGLQGSGPFTGTVDTSRHIKFVVHSSQVPAPLFFQGTILADGSMQGTYCSLNQQNQCSSAAGGAGTWSADPVSPGSF